MWYIKLCHVTIAADYILLLRTTIVVCHTGYVVKQQLGKLFLDLCLLGLTPCTCPASLASLVVRAPVAFLSSSCQPISCLSIALKDLDRSLAVKASPEISKHEVCQHKDKLISTIVQRHTALLYA